MKRATSILFLFLFTSLGATIWTVDKNPNNNANYTDITTAITNANAGDTIYVAGHAIDYGNVTLNKELHLVGPGYFLDENPETNVWQVSAKLERTVFSAGSNGSTLTGFYIFNQVAVYDSDITIRRNYIKYSSDNTIDLENDLNGVVIIQNYIVFSSSISGKDGIEIGSNTSCLIYNNFIEITHLGYSITCGNTSSAQIYNNVIDGHISISNSVFYNNILRDGAFSTNSCDVQFNLCDENQFSSYNNNNQTNVNMSTVFVGTGSTDGMWQLAEGSPAIGAGFDGEDCGIFGGPAPYVLSGQPPIPAVYFLNVPGTGNNVQGLPVTIKVKSHN